MLLLFVEHGIITDKRIRGTGTSAAPRPYPRTAGSTFDSMRRAKRDERG